MLLTPVCDECAQVVAELRAEVLRLREVEERYEDLATAIRATAAGFIRLLPPPTPFLTLLADEPGDRVDHEAS